MRKRGLQIAIDGPSAAGKSTEAKAIAKRFSYIYCDTGAMYRATTWEAMREHIPLNNETKVAQMLHHTKISFRIYSIINTLHQKVFVNGYEVTKQIRSEAVTNNASTIAALSSVRHILTYRQQKIAENGGVVMDGRDIGTTVLPHAEVKIYLVASVRERARRRYKDNVQLGIHTPLKELANELRVRDYKDSHRKTSPLKKAKDAILINSDGMQSYQVVNKIAKIVKNKMRVMKNENN